MVISNSKINKAADVLCHEAWKTDEEYVEFDEIVDDYRKNHLIPLTEVTLKLQEWLATFSQNYYIAQRLKRKPQILNKLKRLSARLTQLQDIGGCRVIVESNNSVDLFLDVINSKLTKSKFFVIKRITDYRRLGRNDSGYRAVHLIIERNGFTLELQIRSRIQHYWAESVERASVIYGRQLKELDGDERIINYFRTISNLFAVLDLGNYPSPRELNDAEQMRQVAEAIITNKDTKRIYTSRVNESFIKGMIAREARQKNRINNWLIVFDWRNGEFLEWQLIKNNTPFVVINIYSDYEKRYPASSGFEVVVIGSSDVATIQHTHHHYFGIESYDSILQSLSQSIASLKEMSTEITLDERRILTCLYTKDYWGVKRMKLDTLKNHYCKEIENIDDAVHSLSVNGLILHEKRKNVLSLNLKRKSYIEQHMGFEELRDINDERTS